MSDPYLGEIRMIGLFFAPRGWALCDGQLFSINQNQSLFSVIGNVYGGDGRTTFALPDLRGRTPVHVGDGLPLGAKAGTETHTLTVSELPTHTHLIPASNHPANSGDPAAAAFAAADGENRFSTAPTGEMRTLLADSGGGQAHNNMQPFTTVNFVIAIAGLFPTRR